MFPIFLYLSLLVIFQRSRFLYPLWLAAGKLRVPHYWVFGSLSNYFEVDFGKCTGVVSASFLI